MLSLMYPKMWFAPWLLEHPVGSCWAAVTSTPRCSFLLSCFPDTCLPSVPVSRYSTWHFPLLTLMLVMIAQYSSLSRSLCKASHPSRESTVPLSWVSSVNFIRVHWTPTSGPVIEMLNRTGPRIRGNTANDWLPVRYSPDVYKLFRSTVQQFIT